MRALADGGDRGARGADQLANLSVGQFGVVADQPGDAIGLVLTLGNRRVARALGARGRFGRLHHHQFVIGVCLTLFDFRHCDFAGANRVTPHQLGAGCFIGNRLNLKNVKTTEMGNLLKGQRRVIDEPSGSRMGHEWLGQGVSPEKRGPPLSERPVT